MKPTAAIESGNTCIFRIFGPNICFDGSLPDDLLQRILEALDQPCAGWTRALSLVAPLDAQDLRPLLRSLGTPDALCLLGRLADPDAMHSRWAEALVDLPLPDRIDVATTIQHALRGDIEALRSAMRNPLLALRREAALGLALAGHPVRVAGWTEGRFLQRARAHPWGKALAEGIADPTLASLLALSVDQDIQPRTLLVLAPLTQLHPTFEALAADVAARVPLMIRRYAAAALRLGGGLPKDPVLHRLLLADVPGDEIDLVAIAVQDADEAVRIAALRALGAAGALPQRALQRLAAGDPSAEVRRLAGAGPIDPLAATLVPSAHDAAARGTGLEQLAVKDPHLAAQLAEALVQDADPDLALVAARVVGAATPVDRVRARVERALPLLEYTDWARRRIGVALLGALPLTGDLREEVHDSLRHLASHDPDPDVQQEAKRALEGTCED